MWIDSITQVNKDDWNALAIPLSTPFLEWEFFYLLEMSKSVDPDKGWIPYHLTLWRGSRLIAIAPLFIKLNSEGEFLYDYHWANYYNQLGGSYFPKMLGMTPFTPVTGYQFLIASGEKEYEINQLLLSLIDNFCLNNFFSSCHFLFPDFRWRVQIETLGYNTWIHNGFIWLNQNYSSFDEFLHTFKSGQRKNIKREKNSLHMNGLTIQYHEGENIPPHFFSLMYECYSNTCDKYSESKTKYLTQKFFLELPNVYLHRVMFIAAYSKENSHLPISLSFYIKKGHRLYGRYWGTQSYYPFLHFNMCYYQSIEYAIAHKLKVFDPGAGGDHKPRRGFPHYLMFSLHRFYNMQMQHVIQEYLKEINMSEIKTMLIENKELPFKIPKSKVFYGIQWRNQ